MRLLGFLLVVAAPCTAFLPSLPSHAPRARAQSVKRSCGFVRKIVCTGLPSEESFENVVPKLGRVPLGGTGRFISEIGVGTIAWGDPTRGYGNQFSEPMIDQAARELFEGGMNLIDSAEVYGYQGINTNNSSEHLVGAFLNRLEERDAKAAAEVVAASKFFPVPWTNVLVGGGVRIGRQAVVDAARASSQRLGRPIDLYQIHFPFPYFGGSSALCEGLAEAIDLGLITNVGVSNFEKQELIYFQKELASHSVPLVSNQIKFSVLDRRADKSGLLDVCRDLDITVLAYEPLEGGLLTGKYHEHQHIDGPQPTNRFSQEELLRKRPVVNLMRFIGTFGGQKTTLQVALNYCMAKGTVPIPGVKNVAQAREILGAGNWLLSETDVQCLDARVDELERASSLFSQAGKIEKELEKELFEFQKWISGGGLGTKD